MTISGLNIKAKHTDLTEAKIKSHKISNENTITDNVLDLSDNSRLAEELTSQDINKVKAVKINNKLVSISPTDLKKMVAELKLNCLNQEGKLSNSFAIDFQNKTGIVLYQTSLKVEEIHQLNDNIESSDKIINSLNNAFTNKSNLTNLFSDVDAEILKLKTSISDIEKTNDKSVLKKDSLNKLKQNLAFLEENIQSYKEILPKAQEILDKVNTLENHLSEKKGSASKTALNMSDEMDKIQEMISSFPKSMENLKPDVKLKALETINKAEKTMSRSIDGIKVSQAEDSQRLLRKGTSMYSIHKTYLEFNKLVKSGRRKGYPATPEGFVKSAIDDVKSDAQLAKKLQDLSSKIKAINFKSIDPITKANLRQQIAKEAEALFQYQGTNKYFIKPATAQAVRDIYLNQFDLSDKGQKINEIEDMQKILELAQNDLAKGIIKFLGMSSSTKEEIEKKDKSLSDLQTSNNKNQSDLGRIKGKTESVKEDIEDIDPNKIDVEKLGFGVKTTNTLKNQQGENSQTKKVLLEKIEKIEKKNIILEKDNKDLNLKVKTEVGKDFVAKHLQYGNAARAIMNKVCDKNGDGKITLSEMQEMDKKKLVELFQEAGWGDMTDQINNIEIYIESMKGQDPNTIIIDFNAEHDYQSYWQYRGDSATKEIGEIARKDSPETRTKIQNEIMTKSNNSPEIKALIDKLSTEGNLSSVNLQAINRILETSKGKEDLAQISVKLNDFINSSKGRFNHKDKLEIVNNILHDLAYPADIYQGNKGTCSAAATQMRIAINNPMQYVDICTTLANDEAYKTTEGKIIKHNDTYMSQNGTNLDERSLSSKIIQNSFMDFAHSYNQKGFKDGDNTNYYDSRVSIDGAQGKNLDDKIDGLKKSIPYLKDASKEELEKVGGGLYQNQIDHLEGSLFGNVSNVTDGYFTRWRLHNTKGDIVGDIEKSINSGVPVTIDFNGHSVIVQEIDKKQNPPKFVINSWSGQYEMTREQLEKSIKAARLED